MAQTVEEVTNIQGIMVKMGLAQPLSRAFVVGTIVAGVSFAAKYPVAAFREDGTIRPPGYLSADPEATNAHFLVLPVVAAATAFLFT